MPDIRKMAVAFVFSVLPGPSWADDEASNVAHAVTDEYGRCFAHSIPSAAYGTAGRTDVYAVAEELVPSFSYLWYAPEMRIACNVSDGKGCVAPALVQIGPWPRGHKPEPQTLAIAFHYDGALKASYSTFDIAGGDSANVSCSVSHYTVIHEIEGFDRSGEDHETVFRLKTIDGRRLTFSAVTGALIGTERSAPPQEGRGACFY